MTEIAHDHRRLNLIHSGLLILTMLALLALLGLSLLGTTGLVWMVVLGLGLLFFGQRISPQLIMRLYNARAMTPHEAPRLFQINKILAARAELPRPPDLYYVPSRLLNAFAVGHNNNAAIGLTDGLLRSLNTRELAAVLAHEMSHIDNNDMRVMGFADVISRITNLFSSFGKLLLFLNLPLILMGSAGISWFAILLLIFAPIIVNLLQLALSRTREFDADVGAVQLTGDPQALASALQKLESARSSIFQQVLMPGHSEPNPSIFRTHPHTDERIERLRALAGSEAPALMFDELPASRRVLPADLVRVAQMPRWRFTSGLWY